MEILRALIVTCVLKFHHRQWLHDHRRGGLFLRGAGFLRGSWALRAPGGPSTAGPDVQPGEDEVILTIRTAISVKDRGPGAYIVVLGSLRG